MDYEIIKLEEKSVAGISARTNNTNANIGQVIGGLWNRFFNGEVYENIPNKKSPKTLGIYTEYAGDEKDDYTVMTACEVEKEPESDELEICTIPAGHYAKFVVKGNMITSVSEAWQKIWQLNLPRSFKCDFEEYQNGDMENAEIHIYIGLK